MAPTPIESLLTRWKDDAGGTYRNWFLWADRLKNFRSIRRGLAQVVDEIDAGTFGNVYKGSSLETVVGSIAEQRQIFKGADHAFLWKPKLRIPDIYESRTNQLAFGRFLRACCDCCAEAPILREIRELDAVKIKGLGPAAANLLYFVHPTIVPPFNTAIVAGYNALTGAKVRLGKWHDYLAMRDGILRLNGDLRSQLSNDLGAVAGLLFDIGSGRYTAPPLGGDGAEQAKWEADLLRVREDAKQQRATEDSQERETTHTDVQQVLRDLGHSLGFAVYIAANDQSRACAGGRLGDGCVAALPPSIGSAPGGDAIKLIDVLWLQGDSVAAAFEVEHSTSIYSGIVRLLDLALGGAPSLTDSLFLVGPDDRESQVRAQLTRPAFLGVASLNVRFLPYGELERNREQIARFGEGVKAIRAVSRVLAPSAPV
jgi:type II restriction enzyme